jgi:Putative beta-barrel porin-2, OmpL-like. bbp2
MGATYRAAWRSLGAVGCALLSLGGSPGWADETTPPPEAGHEQPAVAAGSALSTPPMAGPLTANPDPARFDAGPAGNVFVTGAVTGLAQWQSNAARIDRAAQADISNAQLFIQKTDGLVRFFVEGGLYSLPTLGTPYLRATKATRHNFGPVPLAFATVAPSDDWSIQAGKLPSLSGLESNFTFQNMNVERGLLWNQTANVSRGAQVNHTAGPFALAFSLNDGFYSDRLTWLSGSATWTVDSSNTIAFVGAGNTRTTAVSTFATPIAQNNSQVYNAIYTYASGPWTVVPNLQYTYVQRAPSIGILHDAATYGAALLANYTFDAAARLGDLSLAGFSLPFRVEYIATTGSVASNSPNLLYGPGSNAWSLTVTPTYQHERFFARAEFSYVGADHTTAGSAFGSGGTKKTQARLLVESGFLF